MKILAISDAWSPPVWEESVLCGAADADVIVSCGDLSQAYLDFVQKELNKPVLYVRGNHDKDVKTVREGTHLDSKIVTFMGVRFLGFDSISRDGRLFSDKDMTVRTEIMRRIIDRDGGFDVLVTHHPMRGVCDGEDQLHKGYSSFVTLVDEYKPKYMLYGHMHLDFNPNLSRVVNYNDTKLVNAYMHTIIDVS